MGAGGIQKRNAKRMEVLCPFPDGAFLLKECGNQELILGEERDRGSMT